MQPWIISMGLTAAIVGSAVLLLVPRLDYLAPYRREIFADHGNRIGLNVALALATLEAVVQATGPGYTVTQLPRVHRRYRLSAPPGRQP